MLAYWAHLCAVLGASAEEIADHDGVEMGDVGDHGRVPSSAGRQPVFFRLTPQKLGTTRSTRRPPRKQVGRMPNIAASNIIR